MSLPVICRIHEAVKAIAGAARYLSRAVDGDGLARIIGGRQKDPEPVIRLVGRWEERVAEPDVQGQTPRYFPRIVNVSFERISAIVVECDRVRFVVAGGASQSAKSPTESPVVLPSKVKAPKTFVFVGSNLISYE